MEHMKHPADVEASYLRKIEPTSLTVLGVFDIYIAGESLEEYKKSPKYVGIKNIEEYAALSGCLQN